MFYIARFRNSGNVEVGGEMERAEIFTESKRRRAHLRYSRVPGDFDTRHRADMFPPVCIF